VSRRRSFLEKAKETILGPTESSSVEPLPGLKKRPPRLARRTSFLDSKPIRKLTKLSRR
jgi:hypothetical protein